jgi:carbonic anhydrase
MEENDNKKQMNISKEDKSGICSLKCAFSFYYEPSNTISTNEGVLIHLTYDNNYKNMVYFNTKKYNVSSIQLYSPSLHLYEDKKADMEMIIIHYPELGGEQLYVCIPIYISSYSDGDENLEKIIKKTYTQASNSREKVDMNMNTFQLMDYIPSKKPFYNYQGKKGLVGQVIVFPKSEMILINKESLDIFQKMIKPSNMEISREKFYVNENGANSEENKNKGIYISCQPTGTSKETKEVVYEKNNSLSNSFEMKNVIPFLGVLSILIIYIILSYYL